MYLWPFERYQLEVASVSVLLTQDSITAALGVLALDQRTADTDIKTDAECVVHYLLPSACCCMVCKQESHLFLKDDIFVLYFCVRWQLNLCSRHTRKRCRQHKSKQWLSREHQCLHLGAPLLSIYRPDSTPWEPLQWRGRTSQMVFENPLYIASAGCAPCSSQKV